MEATFTPENATASRRRKVTKFALAGVAVLGVGAALTSAAWSDDVFFGGSSSAADFELQGWDPINGGWVNADSDTLSITLPATALTEVGPNIEDRYTVSVKNGGDLPIYLNTPVTYGTSGSLFANPEPAIVSYSVYSGDGVLAPGEQENVDVIVTGDANWTGTEYQGASGSLVVRIVGNSAP